MKKLLTVSSILAVFALVALATPLSGDFSLAAVVKSSKTSKSKPVPEFSFSDVKEMAVTVTSVNAAEQSFMIKEGNTKKKVLTNDAILIQLSPNSAPRTITLAELAVNKEVHITAKQKVGPKKEYQALVVTQAVSVSTPPTVVQFAAAQSQNAESVTAPAILVSVTSAQKEEIKVMYSVAGSATPSTVYRLASGEVTIPAGSTSAQIPLTIVDDSVTEASETVVLTLASTSKLTLGNQKTHTYTITDNDSARVQFTSAASSGAESVASVSIPVSIASANTEQVLVDYSVTGTATGSGTDYTLANGTVTIPVGSTSANIALTIVEDLANETDETVIISLSNARGAALGSTATYTYTIQDNDQPRVTFASAASSVAENVGSITIPVNLTTAVQNSVVQANYTVTGTATGSGTDFTLANGTVSIPQGQTTANITVTVADDAIDELDETVIITIASATNAQLGSTLVYTLTLQDNDVPVVQFNTATANGDENVTPVSIAVGLSINTAAAVQVTYTVAGTSTGAGTDHSLANGTLTIGVGQNSGTISLPIVDDALQDPGETVVVTITNATNANVGATSTYTYTINDND